MWDCIKRRTQHAEKLDAEDGRSNAMAAAGPRDTETIVLTIPTGAANTDYAYHRIESDGVSAICGAGREDDEFVTMTITAAGRRNTAPCEMCLRIIDQRE